LSEFFRHLSLAFCGERGIRTPGTPKGTTDFESATIDHSASSPVAAKVKKPSKQNTKYTKDFHKTRKTLIFTIPLAAALHPSTVRRPFPACSLSPTAYDCAAFSSTHRGILFGKMRTPFICLSTFHCAKTLNIYL
jgi:hypothetical protein